ncbi:DUF3592 domain-containing protein [Corallococcus llansteffanensis]|nr:DUF3592 domain-containing protein [Corallococcus llansteffanensis]
MRFYRSRSIFSLTPNGRPLTGTDGALFVLMGVIVVVMVFVIFHRDLRVQTEGVWAQGRVVRKEKHARSRTSRGVDYVLHYGFPRKGGWQNAQRNVSRELWERLRAGSSIQVLHDSEDPSLSYPEGEGGMPLEFAMLAFLLAGGTIVTGIVLLLRSAGAQEA